MSEEYKDTPAGNETGAATPQEGNWQEVGRQFEELGQSLAQAFRTTWENEENQRRLQEVRTGLESLVKDVGKAIDESANSPQGQKIRQEAGRTVDSLRAASEQTIQEVRPQLIDALQQLNVELQKLVNRMEKRSAPTAEDNDPDIQI